MTTEYQRLGGRLPEEIEWQIREFYLPKYRKPLNKHLTANLNNTKLQYQCDETNQLDTLLKWAWVQTEAEYGGWLAWSEAMIDQYGDDIDLAEFELGLEREAENMLRLWRDGKVDSIIWNYW